MAPIKMPKMNTKQIKIHENIISNSSSKEIAKYRANRHFNIWSISSKSIVNNFKIKVKFG